MNACSSILLLLLLLLLLLCRVLDREMSPSGLWFPSPSEDEFLTFVVIDPLNFRMSSVINDLRHDQHPVPFRGQGVSE